MRRLAIVATVLAAAVARAVAGDIGRGRNEVDVFVPVSPHEHQRACSGSTNDRIISCLGR